MRVMNSHIVLLVAICLLGTVIGDDPTTNDEVNIGSDKIAQLRNFQVVNHYVTSKDGYIINVIEIKPVKESSKRPVIFNHGSTQSSTYFMTNSVGARPKNFADLDAGSMSQNDLERLLKDDPVAKCFPLLLACFGHRVFLINRRGTEFSLGKTSNISSIGDPIQSVLGSFKSIFQRSARQADEPANPLSGLQSFLGLLTKPPLNLGSIPNTLDSGYWNFSLTEQVDDLVAILEFVGNLTESQKVAYVGHSFGNGLMFMLQSEHPEYADKVEPFLAWSPDFYLGHTTSILAPLLIGLKPILMAGSFPFPPTPIDPLTRTLLAALCQTKLAQRSICLLLEQAMWGFSGDQQETLPAFVASQFYSVSSHEAAQLAQNAEKGKMYKYDYGDARSNMAAYGSVSPPIYNVSNIVSKSISFWRGQKDALATPTDVEILKSDFKVPIDDRFITEVPFNHYDLLFGRNVTTLVNIPALKVVESYKQ